MNRIRALAILNAVAFLLQLGISYLVQIKWINTLNVSEVSEKYPSLFTPSAITFAIWGLIYLALGFFCAYHVVMAWSRPEWHPANKDTVRMGGWFILNNVATALWLLAWTNEDILLSVLLIFVQLLCLVVLHLRLCIYDTRRSPASRALTQFPLSIYFGWITMATFTNVCSYINSTSWDGWGLDPVDWTNILIGVLVFIGMLVMFVRRNVVYGLVIIWGLYGIILKRMEVDSVLYFLILRTAWIGISLLALVAILRMIKNRVSVRTDTFPVSPQPLK